MTSKTTAKKPRTVSVAITDTEIVKNNPNRVQLTLVNNGANEIHVDIDNTVTTSSGLRIAPSGTLSLNKMEDGDLVRQRYFGIASGGASNIRVYEVVKEIGSEE